MQVSAGARKYAKHVYLMKLIEAAIEDTGLPICVHLDHGEDFEISMETAEGKGTSFTFLLPLTVTGRGESE